MNRVYLFFSFFTALGSSLVTNNIHAMNQEEITRPFDIQAQSLLDELRPQYNEIHINALMRSIARIKKNLAILYVYDPNGYEAARTTICSCIPSIKKSQPPQEKAELFLNMICEALKITLATFLVKNRSHNSTQHEIAIMHTIFPRMLASLIHEDIDSFDTCIEHIKQNTLQQFERQIVSTGN